jgi:hypothetical protein
MGVASKLPGLCFDSSNGAICAANAHICRLNGKGLNGTTPQPIASNPAGSNTRLTAAQAAN